MGTKIKCLKCGDIIESKHRHDFVSCSCGTCAVDGGDEYLRIIGDFDAMRIIRRGWYRRRDHKTFGRTT